MGSFFKLNSIRVVNQCGNHFYTSPEIHKDRVFEKHDFIYISRGEWEIYQNQYSYLLRPGDVLILHARQHHYGVNPCSVYTEISYFHMLDDPEDRYVDEVSDSLNYTDTLVHCQSYPDIRELFNLIATNYWKNTEIGKAEVSALCNYLICRLCEISRLANTRQDELVEKAIQLINHQPGRFIPISELAERLYVSEKTLRNRFLKTYKKTPNQYQMEIKLTEAKQILRDDNEISLNLIAEMLGFYDQFHFSKRFKEKFGISPSAYRRQQRLKEQKKYDSLLTK